MAAGSPIRPKIDEKALDEAAQWLAWVILKNRGQTLEGRPIESLDALLVYVHSTAAGGPPPADTPEDEARPLFLGALTAFGVLQGQEPEPPEMFQFVIAFAQTLAPSGLFALCDALIEPLEQRLEAHPDPGELVTLCSLLSALTREQRGSDVSLSYLRRIEPQFETLDPPHRVAHRFATANCLKDMGRFAEAETDYEEARSIAEAHCPEHLAPVLFQLGRLHLEQGVDLAKADKLLEEARKTGFLDQHYYAHDLLTDVAKTQLLISQGQIPQAWQAIETMLAGLGDGLALQEEAYVHNLQLRLAMSLAQGAAMEWSGRMALVAGELSGRRRELGTVYGDLALALANTQQGVESRYWLAKARRGIEDTQEYLHLPALSCTIAFTYYLFGMEQESLEFFRRALAADIDQGTSATHANILAQASFASRKIAPDASRLYELELEKYLASSSGAGQRALHQNGFVIAKRLLSDSPDTLLEWPEALRTGQSRYGPRLHHLQAVLDLRGEAAHPEERTHLPRHLRFQRGILYGRLCGHGHLGFLRYNVGIPPHDAVAWVLRRSRSQELRRRLVLEWLVNPSGLQQELRRGRPRGSASWTERLPRLRAAVMRHSFLQELHQAGPSAGGPHGASEEELREAQDTLLEIYRVWRSEPVLDLEGPADPDRYSRTRSPSAKLSQAQEEFLRSPHAEEVRRRLAEAGYGHDDPLQVVQRLQASGHLDELMQTFFRMGGLPDSKALGIRLDNFLETELIDPIQRLKVAETTPLPYVVEWFQANDGGYWICVDLEAGSQGLEALAASVVVLPHAVGRPKAEEMVQRVRLHLSDPAGLGPGELFLLFPTFFAPLLEHLEPGRELRLRLLPPWSTIPLEQLPFDNTGEALIDRFQVSRLDRFERFTEPSKPPIGRSRAATGRCSVIGDPLSRIHGMERFALPFGRQEALHVADRLGTEPILGSEASRRTVLASLEGRELIHFACHSGHFRELGDFPALFLADGYITGQDLGALDLSSCRLVVLSACDSALGELFGSAPIESIADYLLEAGVDTVVASLWRVHDEETADLMAIFYDALLAGERVSQAARLAFGKEQRFANDTALFPWIVLGKNGRIFGDSP